MASKSTCTFCLRALRYQTPTTTRLTALQRTLTTTPRQHLELEPKKPTTPPTKRQPPPPPSATKPPTTSTTTSSADLATNLASSLRHNAALRSTTEPYIAYGSTETLFLACSAQANYTIPSVLATPSTHAPKNAGGEDVGVGEGWWMTPKTSGALGLEATFNTWAQVVMLHMYLLTVRLRQFPAEHAAIWHQNLLDHFFYAAEDRMAVWHGMSARGVRNKYLKDLWLQWRGLLLSYDEGLIGGDAVMATAVWRNLYRGGLETDVRDLGTVVAYMRRELARLGEMGDGEVSSGEVKFGEPGSVGKMLERESGWVRRAFEKEDLKGLEGR
ncbi:hypothetical protein LTR62_002913 [Meristemomyces frigidus]|uniref:Ubiquinol-cytochrome c chaperone domain-containing protein n=1 Tax=Meristemomyces frigidus TaxID=1508187 RepID=A0AAN7YJU2_9PEZI|nr:hypothetical protein LTR62_002913 [Meristemomyces frigidus]